jgi:4-amino-4-deoxy-L-arabinose transferase-like glycosyltransferase
MHRLVGAPGATVAAEESGGELRRWVVPAILGLALVLRLPILVLNISHQSRFFTPDSPAYVTAATNFHETYFEPTSRLFGLGLLRTPGYPALIRVVYAIAGDRPWAVIVVQIAMGVATVGLVYLLGRRLFRPAVGAWAALALAVDPISILLVNSLQPEIFFTLLLVGGTLFLLRGLRDRSWGWGAAAGILFGVSALVRPVSLYLPAVVIPASLFFQAGAWKKRLPPVLALLLAFSLPVGGWMAHNAEATGVPTLSTTDGITLLYFRAAGALADDEGISYREARARLELALAQRAGPDLNEAERSRVAASLAVRTLLDHPVSAVKMWVWGAVLMVAGPGRDELLGLLGISSRTSGTSIALVGLEFLVLGLILAGAVWGIRVLVRDRKWFGLIFGLAFILYFVIVSSGYGAYSRFRVPVMPFIALLAGYGYHAAVSRGFTRLRSRTIADGVRKA